MKLLAMSILMLFILNEYCGVDGNQCLPCLCLRCPFWLGVPEHFSCLDCSSMNLASVPKFPANFTKSIGMLALYGNQFTALGSGVFNGYSNLRRLDLSDSKITVIPEGLFNSLQSLTVLFLVNNKVTDIPEDVFNGLKNLEKVYLQKNEITNIAEGAFNGLENLEELYLQENEITNISKGAFTGLKNLTRLELYSNKITYISGCALNGLQSLTYLRLDINKITDIPEGAYNDLKRLNELHLDNNEITFIPEGAFNGLKSLKQLYLSSNNITNIYEGAFKGLQSLNRLYLSNNKITQISEGAFNGLQSLTYLGLDNNEITNIYEGAFNGLQSITMLSLDNNNISNTAEGAFNGLKNLEELYLQKNEITNISKGALTGLKNLTRLELYSNKITYISKCVLNGLQSLTYLRLDINKITDIPEGAYNDLKRLNELHLDNNEITYIPEGAFDGLKSLKQLYLSSNNITNIYEGAFKGLQSLNGLYLSNNKITKISEGAFNGLQSLTTLSLNNNKITSIAEGALNDLTKVNWLNLSKNQMKHLHRYVFKDLLSLAILELDINQISHIQPNVFLPLGNLYRLNLTHNNFRDVPPALWTARFSHVTVYLDDNPFNCSCKLLNELKQLRHKVKRLSTSFYEQQCTNLTSICEEQRNFALAMTVGHNCPGKTAGDDLDFMERLETEYTITDGNLNTYGSCNDYESCVFSLWIDLPGVIVVTKVTTVARFRDAKNVTVNIAVGDKLSNKYKPCNRSSIIQPAFFDTTTTQGLCATTPSGRDVRVDISVKDKSLKCNTLISVYEVVVNGYEERKYNLWSDWSLWGPCSTTCGNGIRKRNRTCTNTTSLNCVLRGKTHERSTKDYTNETCNLEPCFQAVYQWTIGGVGGVFVLTVFGIVFWYRKFKMVRYFDGLRPNPNFEVDPNKTLLEQIEELPYDLHWEFPRYDVRFGSIIGEGHFGRVWLAKAKGIRAFNPRNHSDLSSRAKLAKLQDQRVHDYFTTVTESWLLGDCDTTHHYDVAVKTLKESATPKHQMDLASELKLLIYMDRHPNIVNLLACCTIRGDLWVIMEYCDYGSLKKFLSDRRKLFTPSWSKNSADMSSEICFFDLLQMTEQIVMGVMFIHCWKVVHRDLSARNILVDANFNLKIADFGLARSENFVAPSDDILPIKWSSLESLLRHEYTMKSDIWSVAILFWEIFSFGEVPYPGMSSKEVIQQLKEGYRMSAPDHCPEDIWNIICDCWNADPDERPSAMEVFARLDEVKVSVCSAPDGQYYEASGGEYGQAGTVEGPSLDDILKGKENMGFEDEDSKAFADVHKILTEGDMEECGPSTIGYEQYQKLENENYILRIEVQRLRENPEEHKDILEEIKTEDERLKNIMQEMKNQDKRYENIMEEMKTEDERVRKIIDEMKTQEERFKNILEERKTEDRGFKKIIEEMKTQDERFKKIIEEMKTQDERFKNIIEEMKTRDERFKNIKQIINKETAVENDNEISENIATSHTVDDTDTSHNSQAMVHMDAIELMNL